MDRTHLNSESHGLADELRLIPLEVHAAVAGQEVLAGDVLEERVLGLGREGRLRHRREGDEPRDRYRDHQHTT